MKLGFKNIYMQITFNVKDPRNQHIPKAPLLDSTNYHEMGSFPAQMGPQRPVDERQPEAQWISQVIVII